MNISAYNLRSPRLIFVAWITLGLVYGLQRYLLGFFDGYNCDFFAMVIGQLYHFVIYGIVSITALNLNRRVEQNLINLNRASLLKYAAILFSLIMLQLVIAYV